MKEKENEMIFGLRATMEAIEAGKEIEKILIRRELKGELYQEFFTLVRKKDMPHQFVPGETLDRLTIKNHQGVIAFISPIVYHDIAEITSSLLEQGKKPLFLILDKITDVRNFGAIARSAECAGVDAIIIPEQGSARVGADAIKTSAGALHTIPVCRHKNLIDVVMLLQQSGVRVVAATEKGSTPYFESDFKEPLAIILGSEDKGIEPRLLRMADELIQIPIKGRIASLNVSVAASLMVYEAVRQRG
ncbi:MAG: 23S rRNA (guanosine(2251)-2'-O)-methyltransferase RlmB [Bacteroidota bacterium]|nr:23S rRNA (guanosine(2251)-2'-O)-methyltransferase RlmB [Bacteroidota bacterium]